MRTSDLIDAIAADAGTKPKPLGPAFWAAVGVGTACAAVAFAVLLGVRPDVAAALGTVRFPFKFVVTTLLAATAAGLLLGLSRPGAPTRGRGLALAAAPLLLLAAVLIELFVVPADLWTKRAVGSMSMACVTNIPLIAAAPLAALMVALKRGAPSSPALAGALAGLLAGAMAATFYAANCPDDSPLFVAVWYPIAIGIVVLAGAAIGSRALKW